MAEIQGKKKRLSINLSFLTPTDTLKQTIPHKSSKNFESPNGVVGLGILAALNDENHFQDSIFIKPRSRNSVFVTSPPNPKSVFDFKKDNCSRKLSVEEMEMCEEYYTCVISHVGENLINKREYFESDLVKNNNGSESDSSLKIGVGVADFLYSCFLCEKLLHGLDIFMYRGEKAFCSAECRYHQISIDEQKEKHRSAVRKPKELSESPCSGKLQFFAGVAAA